MNRCRNDQDLRRRNFRRVNDDRRYPNDDYSRYAGADFRESDSWDYGPYDINRDFDNGEFKFGREEFGRGREDDEGSRFSEGSEMNRARFAEPYTYQRNSRDSRHPGVSGKSNKGERWLNRDQYNQQRNFADRDFTHEAPERSDYRFGPSNNNQRNFPEDEFGMRSNDYETRRNDSRNRSFDWSRDTRSESFGEKRGFSGKGPKGYKRSDARITEDVCETLTHNPQLDASAIEVSVKDGHVTLTGEAESRRDKRMAETIIENLAGVEDVHNQLRVKRAIEGWIPGIKDSEETKGSKDGLAKGLS